MAFESRFLEAVRDGPHEKGFLRQSEAMDGRRSIVSVRMPSQHVPKDRLAGVPEKFCGRATLQEQEAPAFLDAGSQEVLALLGRAPSADPLLRQPSNTLLGPPPSRGAAAFPFSEATNSLAVGRAVRLPSRTHP
jgi:hypothetical protein